MARAWMEQCKREKMGNRILLHKREAVQRLLQSRKVRNKLLSHRQHSVRERCALHTEVAHV